jgi:hypothetical protein
MMLINHKESLNVVCVTRDIFQCKPVPVLPEAPVVEAVQGSS